MPLQIIRGKITKMRVDAIVNVDNHILSDAYKVGNAEITKSRRLPCKFVIHTVGPRWRGEKHGERDQLTSCYKLCLTLAKTNGCKTAAFPPISSGIFGYPKEQALRVAINTICTFLQEDDMTVYLVFSNKRSFQIGSRLFSDITAYSGSGYADTHINTQSGLHLGGMDEVPKADFLNDDTIRLGNPFDPLEDTYSLGPFLPESESVSPPLGWPAQSDAFLPLKAALQQMDESFAEMLLRKIDDRGITDAQFYKRANMDRKHFSKIRSNKQYKPSKATVLVSAIALELTLDETQELLKKAGFTLSHSNKSDIIIEYFIKAGNYNIFEINEALVAFNQNVLRV